MIGYISGKVKILEDAQDKILVIAGNVGYLVNLPSYIIANYLNDDEIEVYIESITRDDGVSLFGFSDYNEQKMFNILRKVQGVGAKMAMAMLSTFSTDTIISAINSEDHRILSQISGIGPKIAKRIITELKGKQELGILLENSMKSHNNDREGALNNGDVIKNNVHKLEPKYSTNNTHIASEEAVSALINLGFNRIEAYQVISELSNQYDDPPGVEILVKESLKILSA